MNIVSKKIWGSPKARQPLGGGIYVVSPSYEYLFIKMHSSFGY